MTAAWTVGGFLLLALLVVDVFTTAFDARGTGGPIVARQNRFVWGLFRRLRRRLPGEGSRLLATGGPLMAIGTIVTWAALLVLGFTLVYLPHVLRFHFDTDPASSTRLLEAFYYSGMLASTVGLGDVVPPNGWTRALAVVEGLGGFALLTVSTSYILAIYREQLNAQTVAATIDAHLDPEALAGLDELEASDRVGAIARWQGDLVPRLLQVLEAHFQYPVLHYFRPSDPAHALPVQIAELHRFQRGVEKAAADGSAGARALSSHPSHVALVRAIEKYLEEIHRHFVRTELGGEEDDDGIGSTTARLRELLRTLEWDEERIEG